MINFFLSSDKKIFDYVICAWILDLKNHGSVYLFSVSSIVEKFLNCILVFTLYRAVLSIIPSCLCHKAEFSKSRGTKKNKKNSFRRQERFSEYDSLVELAHFKHRRTYFRMSERYNWRWKWGGRRRGFEQVWMSFAFAVVNKIVLKMWF